MKMFIALGLLIVCGTLAKFASGDSSVAAHQTASCTRACMKPSLVLPKAVESELIQLHKGYLQKKSSQAAAKIEFVQPTTQVAAQAEEK